MELDNNSVRQAILELSKLADLPALLIYLIEQTYGGREPAPEPWQITREYMQGRADPASTDRLIALFQDAGCENEIEAARWLLKNDDLVP